jgi:hypothetical protein
VQELVEKISQKKPNVTVNPDEVRGVGRLGVGWAWGLFFSVQGMAGNGGRPL